MKIPVLSGKQDIGHAELGKKITRLQQQINISMTTPVNEIYPDSEEVRGPKAAKGGAIASSDVPLIKKLLLAALTNESSELTAEEQQQAAHLVHRLGRIS